MIRQEPRESTAGFAIGTYHQDHIEDNVRERVDPQYGDADLRREWTSAGLIDAKGITRKGWDLLNADINKLERNSLSWLRKKFQHVRDEGHGNYDELIGSIWFDPANPEHARLIDLASDSPGRSERIDMSDAGYGDLAYSVWTGVSGFGQDVLGGQINFFDVSPEDWIVIEATNTAEYERERAQRQRGGGASESRGRGPRRPTRPREAQGVGPRRAPPYRWVITKDYIGDDVGVEGPRGLDRNLHTNRAHFVIKDDDGETYYEGDIYGEYSGFEPLDDFGTPNAGATTIFYGGKQL